MKTGPPGTARPPLVFLVAAEPSGDLLGARLMDALRSETGGAVRFAGIGGPLMAAKGQIDQAWFAELSVMGILEVLPHLVAAYRCIKQTVSAVRAARPDVLVTIDSPSLSLEISQRLKGEGFPLVHYVAPSVWAWKPWRARRMAAYLDHVLALLPFEPPYFEKHGLATTFVGHPAVEVALPAKAPDRLRESLGIPMAATLICVLPGSRAGEVRRLAPVFGATLGRLAARHPGLHAAVPTVETVAEQLGRAIADWPVDATLVTGEERKRQVFAAAEAALAASGTATIELAAAGVPQVVAYRVNPMSAALVRHFVAVDSVSLPNLVLGRTAVPEFLQGDCKPEKLAAALDRLLADPAARQAQIEACATVANMLGHGGLAPSRRAARTILSVIACADPVTDASIRTAR